MAPSPPARPQRLLYLGSPGLAVAPLEALVAAGYDIVLVVTRPDKRRGRGGATTPSPVKEAAERLGLAVSHDVDDALGCRADLGVVVAYGRLIKPYVLDTVAFVNLHFSLLPRWRGAAPVERAILAGDATTGVCLMALEEELDTGGVYRRTEVPIDPEESLEELRGRLVGLGTSLLLDALASGLGPAVPQAGEPTYAAKVQPDELALDFNRPAVALGRIIRLGRAHTTFRGKRLLVHRARARPAQLDSEPGTLVVGGETAGAPEVWVACSTGSLELLDVQPEGRARQGADAWARGSRPTANERVGA